MVSYRTIGWFHIELSGCSMRMVGCRDGDEVRGWMVVDAKQGAEARRHGRYLDTDTWGRGWRRIVIHETEAGTDGMVRGVYFHNF